MEKLKYLSLIVFSLLMFASCDDNDPQEFLAPDSHVSFPTTTVSIAEESTDVLRIPIAYACTKAGVPVTVTVASSTEGQTNPAIEGEDYIIRNKQVTFDSGAEIKHIIIEPIDNDVFTGRKTFNLVISSVSPDLPQESVQNKVNVSILDNEHPWAAIIGTYTMVAEDYWEEEMISMPVAISSSDDDVNVLLLDLGYGGVAEMEIDEVDGEIIITIPAFQIAGTYAGAYDLHLSWAEPTDDGANYSRSIPITAEFKDGKIIFGTEFGLLAVSKSTGSIAGWLETWLGVVFTKN
jgi:Calx-beta domain.